MPLYKTDGTTARLHNSGVVWAEGKVTSSTGYVDMRFDTARSAGYGFFKLDLTGIRIQGKQLALRGLSAANTPVTSGYFGGYYAHGENDADLDAVTSDRMHSQSHFKISADRSGEHASRYFGHFSIYIIRAVDSSQTSANAARINVFWQGTMRVSSILASSIAGGGVCTGSCDYGIRIGTHDNSSNWGLGSYCLTAFKEGGQF
tara:strand:+ start:518 stop:1126 length:609 start_codon:yes stop_codon:yes gene_type:complete